MNLLITGAWQGGREHYETLSAMGHQVVYLPWEKDPMPCNPDWVEGIIGNGFFLHHSIDAFPALRYIQLTSAGYDRVPLEEIRSRGIRIHNAADVYSIPMAEYALAGVLELYKSMKFFRENQREHRWEKLRSIRELCSSTVLILGCGSVGNVCAERFRAMGCHVIGVNRTYREDDRYEQIVDMSYLEEVLPCADVVILAVPCTRETRHIINEERMHCMKVGAILVNIARGGLVDTEALILGLENGILGAAILDVFEEEPLSEDSPLWDMENVLLTPHNSFVGDGNRSRLDRLILENLREYDR